MKELFVTLAILHGADAALTCTALARGAREANPLLPQRPVANLALKSGFVALSMVAIHKLEATHPKLARGLAAVSIGVESYAIGHNVRVLVTLGGR